MQVEFSNHPLDQLKIRNRITKAMVIEAVTNPDEVLDSYRDRKLYRRTFETDTLEVVTKQEDNKIIIITEYILEGARVMKITYDKKADAAYIKLNNKSSYQSSKKVTEDVLIDYAKMEPW